MRSNFKASGSALRFNVHPRYSPGSPALVREEIARDVMRAEESLYEAAIAGLEGSQAQRTAAERGLSGIVEEHWEFKGRWHFQDLMTGEHGVLEGPERKRRVIGKLPV